MNWATGSGLLVFGIVLGVIGAIMRFAVKVHTTGFNIHAGGVILLIVGIGSAVIGLLLLLMSGTVQDSAGKVVRKAAT